MQVAVAGGSAAGTMTALLLARAGHEVTLLEADVVPVAADVDEAAASCFRQAVPHVVQPHAALPRFRELLRAHLPDVFAALLAAGGAEAPLPTQMPPGLRDRTPREGDERIALLLTRRSTLDWVLQRAVREQPGVTLRQGVRVTGLLASGERLPHVTGVRTDAGDVPADLVVDATGRRSPVDAWLEQIGSAPAEQTSADCGLAYYARHYRVPEHGSLPAPPTTRVLLALDQLTAGLWCADNGTVMIVLAPLVADRRFTAAKDAHVHDAVLHEILPLRPWRDALEPTGPVHPMGGLHNTMRRLESDGAPIVTGLATVGDSVVTTNPTFGRGLSLTLLGAVDLVAALTEHQDEPLILAERLAAGVRDLIAPFYEDQARNDAARLAQLRHHVFGEPLPAQRPAEDRVSFAELRAAMALDPFIFRAFWRVLGALCPPEDVYRDPLVVARTRQVLQDATAATLPQPDLSLLTA